MTDERAKRDIISIGRCKHSGFTLNPISGVDGEFYTMDRKRDLVATCKEIIAARAGKDGYDKQGSST